MSPQLYSVLAHFESPRGHLAKISRTLRLSPETWVSEWIWISPRHAMTLRPLDGNADSTFEEGQLRLGATDSELHWSNGRTEVLIRVEAGVLPPATRHVLELHLS